LIILPFLGGDIVAGAGGFGAQGPGNGWAFPDLEGGKPPWWDLREWDPITQTWKPPDYFPINGRCAGVIGKP
jgi:hypothetical protein